MRIGGLFPNSVNHAPRLLCLGVMILALGFSALYFADAQANNWASLFSSPLIVFGYFSIGLSIYKGVFKV